MSWERRPRAGLVETESRQSTMASTTTGSWSVHLVLAWNVCSDSRLQTSWKSEKSHETTVLVIDFIGFIHMPCSVTSYERWEKSKSQSPTSRGTEGTKNVFFFPLNNTVHVAFYWILYSFIGLLAYISK